MISYEVKTTNVGGGYLNQLFVNEEEVEIVTTESLEQEVKDAINQNTRILDSNSKLKSITSIVEI